MGNKKISTLSITIFLLFIALFKIYLVPKTIQQVIKIACIIFITFFIFKNIKNKKVLINNKMLCWCAAIIMASIFGYVRHSISIDNVFNSVLHSVCIYYIYVIIKYSEYSNKIDLFLKILFNVLTIYNIASLVTVLLLGSSSEYAIIYFLGDKFRTSYYFIMWCAVFYCIKNKDGKLSLNNKFLFYILMGISIFTIINVKCSTTLVGVLVFLILYLLFKNKKIKIFDYKIITLLLVISTFIIFLFNSILTNEIFKYIIVNILHENVNLTGRLHIYSFLIEVFKKSPLLGYGYGNYAVGLASGFGNAQNAIIQLVIDYGLIGLLFFYLMFREALKNHMPNKLNLGMYFYLIVTIVCSSVEISFNYLFYIALIFIMISSSKGELIDEKK